MNGDEATARAAVNPDAANACRLLGSLAMEHAPDITTTLADRRRPGRLATVSPQLLPLLRASERALLPPLPEELLPARLLGAGQGVLLGVFGGALLWAAGIGTLWSLLR